MSFERLLSLLDDERAALAARDWARIGVIAEEKAAIVDALENEQARPTEDIAKQIEQLAAENARLLGLMREAAGSAHARLSGIADRVRLVGYGQHGERLSAPAEYKFKRV